MYCGLNFTFPLRSQSHCRHGDTDGGEDWAALRMNRGRKTNDPANELLKIAGNTGFANFLEFFQKLEAFDYGVVGTRRESIRFENAINKRSVLKGCDDFSQRSTVGWKKPPDSVGDTDFMKTLYRIEDMNPILEQVSQIGSFAELGCQMLEFRSSDIPHFVSGVCQPTKGQLTCQPIGAVQVSQQAGGFLKGKEHSIKRCSRKRDERGDVAQ